MPNLTSRLTVRLIDAVSGPARQAARAIRGIGTAVDQTNAKRLTVGDTLRRTTQQVRRFGRDMRRHTDNIASGVSLPLGLFTGFGARAVYEFAKVGNAVQAVTGMTDEQRESLEKYAQELNKIFPFSNKEIMQAAFELARAGLSFEQVMGTLRGSLNLALAGDIGLGESADIATNVLTAMRLPIKSTEQAMESLTRVNDAMAYAAVRSNTDVRMMGDTFKYVGPMAAAAGMSIEDVTAAAMIMANNGIRASEAGVALRSALVRMVKPVKPMIRALGQLNINLDDFVKRGRQITAQDVITSLQADGIDASSFASQIDAALKDPKLQGSLSALTARLTEIIAGDGSIMDKSVLAEAITDTLTAAGAEVDFFGFIRALKEKGADIGHIANVFDARQGSRLITLLAGDLEAVLADVVANAPGSTDEMSRIRMKGVVGDVAAFIASLENLFLAIAKSGVLKTATNVIQSMTKMLEDFAKASPKLLEFTTYGLLLLGILGPLGIMLGGVASAFALIWAVSAKILAGAGIVGGAAGLGAAGGAAGAAAGAVGGAAGAAAKGGVFRRLLGWGGIGAAAWGIKELLGMLDPKGNLWGLTEGVDAWFEKTFGFNPSNVGGGERKELPGTEADDAAERRARLDEINARLKQIEAGTHPSMRDAPNPERDRLMLERNLIEGQAAEGAAAGSELMGGYEEALQRGFDKVHALVDAEVKKLKAKLSTSAGITITPRVDGMTLRGVHADTGVE